MLIFGASTDAKSSTVTQLVIGVAWLEFTLNVAEGGEASQVERASFAVALFSAIKRLEKNAIGQPCIRYGPRPNKGTRRHVQVVPPAANNCPMT